MNGQFFEIDFLEVESAKSGDAISIRYSDGNGIYIHVVDGGYQETGGSLVEHINKYYGYPKFINHVVATHPDGDHAGGLQEILESFDVGALWMIRPWEYADEIYNRFKRYSNIANLRLRLRELYPNIAALEDIARKKQIQIYEPFQGQQIGPFTVLAPTKARYLDLVVESERTPESNAIEHEQLHKGLGSFLVEKIKLLAAAWGAEKFPEEGTSNENEMSVVQYAELCGKTIMLTADAGRDGLAEAAAYAPLIGINLPGIDRFQIPHHGSRRNVSTEILDTILGERLLSMPDEGEETFTAIVSAASKDEDHPRKVVIRAMRHRGAKVISTETGTKRTGYNAPDREGWVKAEGVRYPEEMED